MARNRLQERDNNLTNVEYDPLLKVILEALKRHSDIFTVAPTSLCIHAERVAQEVVNQVRQGTLNDVRTFVYSIGTTHVTANFFDGEAFNTFRILIERVRDQLSSHLKTALAVTLPSSTLEEYIWGLVSDPERFVSNHKDPKAELFSALTYPFGKPTSLKRRRLHLQARNKPSRSDIRLLGHKLMISVRDMQAFEQRLVDALCNQLEESDTPPGTKELERIRLVLEQRLQDESSELGTLKRILKRESFGRLQKEAKILYLDYIARAIGKKQQQDHSRGLLLLQELTRRLRLLEAFLHAEQPDEYYQVSYNGHGANYRSLFSRSEVFDLLPVFADIEGTLGETYNKDKGEQEFTLGVKLKLNGSFRTYSSVFRYYLTLLDPSSQEHKERKSRENIHQRAFIEKVLKLALLYYFVFRNMDDTTYDPTRDVEAELLVDLRRSEEQDNIHKERRLAWLKRGMGSDLIEKNLQALRTLLKEFVKSAGSEFDGWQKSLYLSVSADIIEQDEDRMRSEKKFFRADAIGEKGMGMLKYIAVEDASASGNTLCSLPVSITFEPMYYYSTEQVEQQFSMSYGLRYISFLPVIYIPTTALPLCQDYYKDYKHVEISYASTLPYANQRAELFIYHFTYLLLSYLSLKLLSDHICPRLEEGKRLFLPLMRIHQTEKATEKEEKHGEEEFLRALSKALSHIIREQGILSNAQGLHIEAIRRPNVSPATYKLPNALSSLYSVLPKYFSMPTAAGLENLAVIVVSSRKCDAHKDSSLHLSNVYGEVIGIRRTSDPSRVSIIPLDTFSSNEASDNMYRTPTVLRDQAKKCYMRGYRHILYVAQAPYSSSLHLTSAETVEEQFFMSGSIIESLKGGHADLHIYPVYCDKFYVVKIDGKIVESLYVDDTSELRSLVNDPSRSSVVFFNLLNGLIVGKGTDRLYNGVVSYATLINVYDDPIYDQDIRNHLLDDSQPGSLKKHILNYLTLLHFARYEREANTISMKLDPYEEIIGSDSVGTLSMIDHTDGGTQFNMLAFLTEVRNVLNRQYSGYVSTLLEENEQEEGNDTRNDEPKNGDGDGGEQA